MEHTPTPISFGRPFPPTKSEFEMLCKENTRLNNSHDELVEALKETLRLIRMDKNFIGMSQTMMYKNAKKALAKAEGR